MSVKGTKGKPATGGTRESLIGVPSQQRLFLAVIHQAFADALTNTRDMRHARAEALIWLRGNSEDFSAVCDWAGIAPEVVRRWAVETFGSKLHEHRLV